MTVSSSQGDNWQDIRKIVLSRDDHKCRGCETTGHLHVHHLIPRHLGGPDEPENLISLCPACHAAHHPTLQVSLARSFIERWAIRLSRFLDVEHEIPDGIDHVTTVLRLLGKDAFREGQLDLVLAALRGESMLAIRPTGSGKTLCFQIPAMVTRGTAYVISPLKALMIDQSIGFHKTKIPATFINSDLTMAEKEGRYQLLEKKALKFLFLTPERLDPDRITNPREIEKLREIRPNYLVVDEAHCVDRWGNDFRPSYGRLAEVRKELGNPAILAFTATAGLGAQKRILTSLGIPDAKVFISDVDRPNITLIRHEEESNARRFEIIKNCVARNHGKAMIFVPTKRVGAEVRAGLSGVGLEIPFYHGQMSPIDREFLLGQFTGRLQPEINNIICTNAFGMGLDIPDVHLVIHWTQPESIEDYLQEFGRAGRDGKPSTAIIFKSKNDVGLREFMARRTAAEAIRKGKQQDDIQSNLAIKIQNIKNLDQMIKNRHRCFRQQILRCFSDDSYTKRKSITMRILEWLLCKKSNVRKTSLCCDFCNAAGTKQYLMERTDNVQIGSEERHREQRTVPLEKKDIARWKWKPTRWWIVLIAFWLVTTVGGSLLSIDGSTGGADALVALIFISSLLFSAFTDRGRSWLKSIGWLVLLWFAFGTAQIPSLLLLELIEGPHPRIDAHDMYLRSLLFTIIAMRRSRFFVERIKSSSTP